VALILDAGALIAFESKNPTVVKLLADAQAAGEPVRTTSGVTAQVWRDQARQVMLSRLLRGVDERSIDPAVSKRIGKLLASSETADVVDASIIDIARDGDEILTSDPDDVVALAKAAGRRLTVIPIST
jgi:K+/H+ antiporter YhaU regulatory subunit KhtT